MGKGWVCPPTYLDAESLLDAEPPLSDADPSHVDRMTDTCKNITSPQTSVVDGNKVGPLIPLFWTFGDDCLGFKARVDPCSRFRRLTCAVASADLSAVNMAADPFAHLLYQTLMGVEVVAHCAADRQSNKLSQWGLYYNVFHRGTR